MYLFPTFSFQIITSEEPSVAKARFYNTVKANGPLNSWEVEIEENQLVFVKEQESILFVNSFFPTVAVSFTLQNFGTKIILNFELRKSVKIFYVLFLMLSFAMQGLLLLTFRNTLTVSLPMLLPSLIIIFTISISHIVLRLSSMCIIKEIISYYQGQERTGDGSLVPPG